jgi:type IV pilus assembly protein PilF
MGNICRVLYARVIVFFACVFSVFSILGCAFDAVDSRIEALTSAEPTPKRYKVLRRLALATAYYEQGLLSAAEQECRATLLIDPDEAQVYNLLGLIHQQNGDIARAENSFEQSLKLLQARGLLADAATVLHNKAWLYCQQKRFNDSFDLFQNVLSEPTYRERAKTKKVFDFCIALAQSSSLALDTVLRQDFSVNSLH